MDSGEDEKLACVPKRPVKEGFNPCCTLPHGLTIEAVKAAMEDFCEFLQNINTQLASNGMPRLESIIMQANFSSIVGEFIKSGIPKHCPTIVANAYHNGHPDLIPAAMYTGNSIQHGDTGIEIKGSRYRKAWQGHNAEDCWLMVVVFTAGRPTDKVKAVRAAPFAFVEILGAQLVKADWKFAGRSETSRRTITASVIDSGYQKMVSNWIYRDPVLSRIIPVEAASPSEAQSEMELP